MAPNTMHAVDILEQGLGKEQASEALMKIITITICKLLPCNEHVQQQTEKFSRNCAKVAAPSIPVLLATLTYLERYFQSAIRFHEEDPLVRCRVILIALLTAYKYVAERGVLNKAWTRACKGIFTVVEINKMERLFLTVLQYRLMVEDNETQVTWRNWAEQLLSQASDYQDHQGLSHPSSVSISCSSVNASLSAALSGNNLPSPQSSVEHSISASFSKRRFTLPHVAVKWSGWKPIWSIKSPA
ncbi:hypothetical protein BC830DRAFT_122780 [Chytriomyces sp. MP71]|nr:hypothetical protein BC830DRAFT_122780 [Chytriomyces sp. MP71]